MNEIQVVGTVLSTDQENAYDMLAMIGASAALTHLRDPLQRAARRPCASAASTANSSSTPR